MVKVNNKNIRMVSMESFATIANGLICSKLTIKTPERCHWCRSSVFIVNSKHIKPLTIAA